MTSKTERLGVRDARGVFPDLVERAADGERIVVTYHGKDRCAIVPMVDLELIEQIAAREPAKRRK